MTIAYWCVFIAAVLPYVFTVLAKTGPEFCNASVRIYLENLQGWRKRAHWTQLNGFEAFPAFAASVIIASLNHAPQSNIDTLAMIFIVARILHGIFYISNKPTLRSFVWFIGFFSMIALFMTAAFSDFLQLSLQLGQMFYFFCAY